MRPGDKHVGALLILRSPLAGNGLPIAIAKNLVLKYQNT